MEASDAGSEVRPRDSQKVEGLGINDVETTASVHEHLGEACVGDDGINDEWVDSRIGDIVWVVITVKSDGHLRPIKEEGGHELHGEDLSTFLLKLPCQEARRGSSVYHEAVMNLGKPLILVVSLRILLLVVFLDA
jgi:predicted ABC-class ATPase